MWCGLLTLSSEARRRNRCGNHQSFLGHKETQLYSLSGINWKIKTLSNMCRKYIQWTLRYPDARYPDASVSGQFFLGTDFLNVILSHLSGIPRSGSGQSVFTTKCIFTLYFWFTYPDSRFWWQVSVHSGQHSWAGC